MYWENNIVSLPRDPNERMNICDLGDRKACMSELCQFNHLFFTFLSLHPDYFLLFGVGGSFGLILREMYLVDTNRSQSLNGDEIRIVLQLCVFRRFTIYLIIKLSTIRPSMLRIMQGRIADIICNLETCLLSKVETWL